MIPSRPSTVRHSPAIIFSPVCSSSLIFPTHSAPSWSQGSLSHLKLTLFTGTYKHLKHLTNRQAKLTLGWKTRGLLEKWKGKFCINTEKPWFNGGEKKKSSFILQKKPSHAQGFLFLMMEARGWGWRYRGYDRRCSCIVFKWGAVGGRRCIVLCWMRERKAPPLPPLLSPLSASSTVFTLPPPSTEKKAEQVLALLVNEALTSLAHTHTH